MKKRITALLLTAVLAAGCALPAAAAGVNVDQDVNVFIEYDEETVTPREKVEYDNHNMLSGKTWWYEMTGIGQAWTEEMAQTAAKVVGKETDPYKKAKLIYDWVHKNIKYDDHYELRGRTSAVQAFQTRLGICHHFAKIFASMCQSQGIPCVQVEGYSLPRSYADPYTMMLYGEEGVDYHAWNMFYADGRWHWADPTWGGAENFDPPTSKFSKRHFSCRDNDGVFVSDWAQADVLEAYSVGLFSPELADKWRNHSEYEPEYRDFEHSSIKLTADEKNLCTRADFCALVVPFVEKALGQSVEKVLADRGAAPGSFEDTEDGNVLAAAGLGIINGVGENRFDPEAGLTREQAAVILARAAGVVGMETASGGDLPFEDVAENAWARDGISWCYDNGVMNGTGETTFSPADAYSREQAVVTFYRLLMSLDQADA